MVERFMEGDIDIKFDEVPTVNNDIECLPIFVAFTVRVTFKAEEDTSNCYNDLDWEVYSFEDFVAFSADGEELPYKLTEEWEDHLKKLCHFRKELIDRIEDQIWQEFNFS